MKNDKQSLKKPELNLGHLVSAEVETKFKETFFPKLYTYEIKYMNTEKEKGKYFPVKENIMYVGIKNFLQEHDFAKCYQTSGHFIINGFSVFNVVRGYSLAESASTKKEEDTFLFKELIDIYTSFGWEGSLYRKIIRFVLRLRNTEDEKELALKRELRKFEAILLRHVFLEFLYQESHSVCNELNELYKKTSFDYVDGKKHIIKVLKNWELSKNKYNKIIQFTDPK